MKTLRTLAILALSLSFAAAAQAQELKTANFLDNYLYGYRLNPSVTPEGTGGFFGIPVGGNLGLMGDTNFGLSNFLFPLVETLVHAPSIPYALQRAPELMQGVFCHAGTLCHQQTAETLHLPWQDILSLCWNLN